MLLLPVSVGGSNAMGMFAPFVEEEDVQLYGVEAGGSGIETGKHAATLTGGSAGILHGTLTYLLQDQDGQIQEAHSISAGLDYPGIGRSIAIYMHPTGSLTHQSQTMKHWKLYSYCRKRKDSSCTRKLTRNRLYDEVGRVIVE